MILPFLVKILVFKMFNFILFMVIGLTFKYSQIYHFQVIHIEMPFKEHLQIGRQWINTLPWHTFFFYQRLHTVRLRKAIFSKIVYYLFYTQTLDFIIVFLSSFWTALALHLTFTSKLIIKMKKMQLNRIMFAIITILFKSLNKSNFFDKFKI